MGERFEVAVPETYQHRFNLAPQQRTLIVRDRDGERAAEQRYRASVYRPMAALRGCAGFDLDLCKGCELCAASLFPDTFGLLPRGLRAQKACKSSFLS
jgi:hypothetical protein